MIENDNIEERIVQGPPNKEYPLGRLFSVMRSEHARKTWVFLTPLYPDKKCPVVSLTTIEFKREYELLHPAESSIMDKTIKFTKW